MVVKRGKILFRVQYKVKEGDTPINMRASTESLESLHKLLCGMDSFRTPLKEWALCEIHEDHGDGTVSLIPQAHIANLFDWQYGFNQKAKEQEEEEEKIPWAPMVPWTQVHVVRRKKTQPLVSSATWWKEVINAN